MAWNPTIPATNADLLSAPVRDNFGALDTALMAALTTLANGAVLTKAAGPVLAGVPAVATGAVLASAGVTTAPTWNTAPSLTSLTLVGPLRIVNTAIVDCTVGTLGITLQLDAAPAGGRQWSINSSGTGQGYRGTGSFSIYNPTNGECLSFDATAAWYVQFTGLGVRRIEVAGVDTMGAGYRALRVLN